VILNLTFQDFKQIAPAGRVEKNGITLVAGRPLIPDLRTDATGTRARCGSPSMNPICVLVARSWSSRICSVDLRKPQCSEMIEIELPHCAVCDSQTTTSAFPVTYLVLPAHDGPR